MAKLLGTYECELHRTFVAALNARPNVFVDIGSAEGYYAVGFALRSPGTRVYAYDIDRWARNLCREMAILNGVGDRVVVKNRCTTKELSRLPLQGAFVLSDCEGAETEVFTENAVSSLRQTTVLVELHDQLTGIDVLSILSRRFDPTHHASIITSEDRVPEDYPELADSSPEEQALALTEFRVHSMAWALFSPRHREPEQAHERSPRG